MKGKAGKQTRRENAKKYLQEQLKKGHKPEKVDGKTTDKNIPLTEGDKKRINREIENLSTKKKSTSTY